MNIAVCDDEGYVPVSRHVVERLKTQRGLLYPAVVIIGRNRFAGRHSNKSKRRYAGEDTDGQTCKTLVHNLTLQVLSWDVPDESDT